MNQQKTEKDYIGMQKSVYEGNVPPEDIVGNFAWHEEYPYETFLLHRNGDIRKPLFDNTEEKIALDFACGPGRMVKRMRNFFKAVDGCDISSRLLEFARKYVNTQGGGYSNFYLTNGNDLGNTPLNYYDFVYCTISMQHIASYTIRRNILKNIFKVLKPRGKICLQMGYNRDVPFVHRMPQSLVIGDMVDVRAYIRGNFASYFADDFGATATNGSYDVAIGERDLPDIKKDLETIFSNVTFWFSNISNYWHNLEGQVHGEYWATDWIYIYGEKPNDLNFGDETN